MLARDDILTEEACRLHQAVENLSVGDGALDVPLGLFRIRRELGEIEGSYRWGVEGAAPYNSIYGGTMPLLKNNLLNANNSY